MPYLLDEVRAYEGYGYNLVEIRPCSFWKDFDIFHSHIAILEKQK